MYEVEYKVELSKEEQDKLVSLFREQGFVEKKPVTQNDYYIEAKESPYKGFDLRRYRDEGDKIFYTEKTWEKVDGEPVRREVEKEVTREEFDTEVAKYPETLKIKKERQTFSGKYQDKEMHIDMDTIKFDHSPGMRYFIEAEIIAQHKEQVKELREFIIGFLKEKLGKTEIIESPGMFTMAFTKK